MDWLTHCRHTQATVLFRKPRHTFIQLQRLVSQAVWGHFWHLPAHPNIITALSFCLLGPWSAQLRNAGKSHSRPSLRARLTFWICSYLNYLSNNDLLSAVSHPATVDANFKAHYQQAETALSAILESTAVQWDALTNGEHWPPITENECCTCLSDLSAPQRQNLVFPLDLRPITISLSFWVTLWCSWSQENLGGAVGGAESQV